MKSEHAFETHELRFVATRSSGEVSAILMTPANPKSLLVLGHGAGAGMRHRFMETLAQQLAANGVATFRYHFPYMERDKRAPDPQPILLKTVRSAVRVAGESSKHLPLFVGGKSLGGRMTSMAAATEPLPETRGIVFFGFPLHAPGKPSNERAAHLAQVKLPMLFLQGTRDHLCNLDLLRPICENLGQAATLHVIAGADHGFHVLKSSGRTGEDVLIELAQTSTRWFLQQK